MEMNGKSSNNGESEGKGKAPSSEDLQEQISCANEGTIIYEEANLPETKDAKGKEIAESSMETKENIHPIVPADTIVFSLPDHDVCSEDVNEQIPTCDEGTIIIQETKEVEMTSNEKGKEIAEISTSNAQENILQEQTELVSGLPAVDVVVSQMNDGCVDKILKITYPCGFCKKMFPSAQALGGHQNSHREERQLAKKRKRSEEANLSNPYPPAPIYTDYNLSFNSESLASPPIPSPNPRGNTQYPLSYFGRSLTMSFNDRLLSSYDRLRMTGPYQRNSGNVNYAIGNLNSVLGGQLGGFQTQNGNSNSVGCAFNYLGIINGSGSGSSTLGRLPSGNSHAGGFEAASTGTRRGDNSVGLSEGGSNENQDPVLTGDGTIDLLSRVGMGSGEDEESDGDRGDNETES